MISSVSKVLIVGGGIGGMAAAIALAERGVAVDLIDLDPDWRVYGAGITITGSTLRAYKRLGMVDEIAREGAITPGSAVFTFFGKFLHDLDEPPLEEGLPATGGIMRPVLHHLMQQRVQAAGCNVRLGITVDELENVAGGVDVTFSDATSWPLRSRDRRGQRPQPGAQAGFPAHGRARTHRAGLLARLDGQAAYPGKGRDVLRPPAIHRGHYPLR